MLDQLLNAWADTSGFLRTIDARWKDRHGEDAHVSYSGFGGIDASDSYATGGNGNARDTEWLGEIRDGTNEGRRALGSGRINAKMERWLYSGRGKTSWAAGGVAMFDISQQECLIP